MQTTLPSVGPLVSDLFNGTAGDASVHLATNLKASLGDESEALGSSFIASLAYGLDNDADALAAGAPPKLPTPFPMQLEVRQEFSQRTSTELPAPFPIASAPPPQSPMQLEVRQEFSQRTSTENVISNLKHFRVTLRQFRLAPDGRMQPAFDRMYYRLELLCKENVPVDTIMHAQSHPPLVLLGGETTVCLTHGEHEVTLKVGRSVTSYIYRSHKLRDEREATFRLRVQPLDPDVAAANPQLIVTNHPFKIVTKLKPPDPNTPLAPLYDAPPVWGLTPIANPPVATTTPQHAQPPAATALPMPAMPPLSTQLSSPLRRASMTQPTAAPALTPTDAPAVASGVRITPITSLPSSVATPTAEATPVSVPTSAATHRYSADSDDDIAPRRQRSEPTWQEHSLSKRQAALSPTGPVAVPAPAAAPIAAMPLLPCCGPEPDSVPSFDVEGLFVTSQSAVMPTGWGGQLGGMLSSDGSVDYAENMGVAVETDGQADIADLAIPEMQNLVNNQSERIRSEYEKLLSLLAERDSRVAQHKDGIAME